MLPHASSDPQTSAFEMLENALEELVVVGGAGAGAGAEDVVGGTEGLERLNGEDTLVGGGAAGIVGVADLKGAEILELVKGEDILEAKPLMSNRLPDVLFGVVSAAEGLGGLEAKLKSPKSVSEVVKMLLGFGGCEVGGGGSALGAGLGPVSKKLPPLRGDGVTFGGAGLAFCGWVAADLL